MVTPSVKSTAGRGYIIDLKNPIEGFTKLHRASWLGNQEKVRNCLKTIPVYCKDDNLRTPLHLAAAGGHTSVALVLMEKDLDFNDRDSFGKTAIMKAIECSHKETAQAMIAQGADLTASDFYGNTAMHIALRENHFDIAAVMLQYFPNGNLTNADGTAPLHILAEGFQIKLTRKFIDHGASVNAVDNRGRTPLMIASKRGCFPMVSLLLKHGSSPHIKDVNGWTSLDYASIVGYTQIINILEKYMRGEVGDVKDSESSSSEDEEEFKIHPLLGISSQRVVPIRMESETMFLKRQQRLLLEKQLDEKSACKRGEGIRDVTGKLTPMPNVIASLQAQANKLGDINKWLLQHQSQLEEKAKDRDELKEHAKKLWEERKKLLDKLESRKNKARTLVQQLEKVPSIKETEILEEQVAVLGEALNELKQQHEKVVAQRDDLQDFYNEEYKSHKNSSMVLNEKAEQLKKENDVLYEKLTEIQNQTRNITDDLSKRCNMADELVNNLKILLRGTYKLLEEKNGEVNRVMNEVDAQQYLFTKTKNNCHTVNEENIKVEKTIEEVDNRMKSIRKRLAKIHSELDSYPITKSLINAGIIEAQKPPSEEPKKKRFLCCRKKERTSSLHEMKPEPEVVQLAEKKYDLEELMALATDAPTVCETNVEQVRYSWLADDGDQSAEMMVKDLGILSIDGDRETGASSPANSPEESPSNATENSSEETIPPHLQAKLAVVAAKYSK